ncbi:hypothetical protein FF1_029000 [Malus domestica]
MISSHSSDPTTLPPSNQEPHPIEPSNGVTSNQEIGALPSLRDVRDNAPPRFRFGFFSCCFESLSVAEFLSGDFEPILTVEALDLLRQSL